MKLLSRAEGRGTSEKINWLSAKLHLSSTATFDLWVYLCLDYMIISPLLWQFVVCRKQCQEISNCVWSTILSTPPWYLYAIRSHLGAVLQIFFSYKILIMNEIRSSSIFKFLQICRQFKRTCFVQLSAKASCDTLLPHNTQTADALKNFFQWGSSF